MYYLSLAVAPPLTLDTLLPLLKGVKDWQRLAEQIILAQDDFDECYDLPSTDLIALQHMLGSDEECIKFVTEKFLRGEGGHYQQPSWRAVIWSLYRANEIQLASMIKSYAEPHQGQSIVDVPCRLVRAGLYNNTY